MHTEQVQRRTVRVLMTSTAFGYAGFLAMVAVVPLLAAELTGSDLLAGIPSAAGTLGTAVTAAPLALWAKRRGRRPALWIGFLVGVCGAGLAAVAGTAQLLWLLVLSMALIGMGWASNLQSRFAAADLASEETRAQAIALVVWVGTIGAVIGPPAALWANRLGVGMGMAKWVAPMMLGALGFGVAALIIARFLRPDPLEVAGGVDRESGFENPLRGMAASFRVIARNRYARLALVVMALSQMAMVAVMTMTPGHMRDHGQADLSTFVISIHVLGMFGLSPLVGRWADRFGRLLTAGVGAAVLGVGTVLTVVAGYVPVLMFVGLFMLGLGWSFALISGSALLTESLPADERVGAQGIADVAMSLLGACAAFGSGFVKEMAGFHWLANVATVSSVVMLLAITNLRRRETQPAV